MDNITSALRTVGKNIKENAKAKITERDEAIKTFCKYVPDFINQIIPNIRLNRSIFYNQPCHSYLCAMPKRKDNRLPDDAVLMSKKNKAPFLQEPH
jgi:hypothetical protein